MKDSSSVLSNPGTSAASIISASGFASLVTGAANVSPFSGDDEHVFSNNAADYELQQAIGFGSSAVVRLATYRPTNKKIAVKVIDLDKFERNQIDELRRETHVMQLCKHPNVLPVYAAFVRGSSLHVVTPYCAAGSCLDIMRFAHPRGLREVTVATILLQALQGLEYLHRNGHIHRDVKAGNLLLAEDGTVMLADFGVAATLNQEEPPRPKADRNGRAPPPANMQMRRTFVGTPCWMAPEVMEQSGYDQKADIWSFGITALELANGHAPLSKYPPIKVLMLTLSNDPPTLDREKTHHKYSKTFKEMIDGCLHKVASRRPAAEKVLAHPFFRSSKKKAWLAQNLLSVLPPITNRGQGKLGTTPVPGVHTSAASAFTREVNWDAAPKGTSWDFSDKGDGSPSPQSRPHQMLRNHENDHEDENQHDNANERENDVVGDTMNAAMMKSQLPSDEMEKTGNLPPGHDAQHTSTSLPQESTQMSGSTTDGQSPPQGQPVKFDSLPRTQIGRFVVEQQTLSDQPSPTCSIAEVQAIPAIPVTTAYATKTNVAVPLSSMMKKGRPGAEAELPKRPSSNPSSPAATPGQSINRNSQSSARLDGDGHQTHFDVIRNSRTSSVATVSSQSSGSTPVHVVDTAMHNAQVELFRPVSPMPGGASQIQAQVTTTKTCEVSENEKGQTVVTCHAMTPAGQTTVTTVRDRRGRFERAITTEKLTTSEPNSAGAQTFSSAHSGPPSPRPQSPPDQMGPPRPASPSLFRSGGPESARLYDQDEGLRQMTVPGATQIQLADNASDMSTQSAPIQHHPGQLNHGQLVQRLSRFEVTVANEEEKRAASPVSAAIALAAAADSGLQVGQVQQVPPVNVASTLGSNGYIVQPQPVAYGGQDTGMNPSHASPTFVPGSTGSSVASGIGQPAIKSHQQLASMGSSGSLNSQGQSATGTPGTRRGRFEVSQVVKPPRSAGGSLTMDQVGFHQPPSTIGSMSQLQESDGRRSSTGSNSGIVRSSRTDKSQGMTTTTTTTTTTLPSGSYLVTPQAVQQRTMAIANVPTIAQVQSSMPLVAQVPVPSNNKTPNYVATVSNVLDEGSVSPIAPLPGQGLLSYQTPPLGHMPSNTTAILSTAVAQQAQNQQTQQTATAAASAAASAAAQLATQTSMSQNSIKSSIDRVLGVLESLQRQSNDQARVLAVMVDRMDRLEATVRGTRQSRE